MISQSTHDKTVRDEIQAQLQFDHRFTEDSHAEVLSIAGRMQLSLKLGTNRRGFVGFHLPSDDARAALDKIAIGAPHLLKE